MSQHPIVLSEVLDLPSLGISADAIKFGSTTMESNNFIVSCEMVDGKQTVCMIDMKDGNKISRKPISAEAAIMNPVSKVLALRAGTQLQTAIVLACVRSAQIAMACVVDQQCKTHVAFVAATIHHA